jgi:hypothetical protein
MSTNKVSNHITDNFYNEIFGEKTKQKRDPTISKKFWRGLKNYDIIVGIFFGVIGFIFGYIGFYNKFAGTADQNILSIIYHVVRLFIFDFRVESPIPWELNVARLLCPLASSYSVLITFLFVFRKKIKYFRLKYYRNHVIICGINKWTVFLAKDFKNYKNKVVMITNEASSQYYEILEDYGIPILKGNHSDQFILKQARINKAKYLIAFTKNDTQNMEIGINAIKFLKGKHSKSAFLHIFIHIFKKQLFDAFSKHEIFIDTQSYYSSRLFNIFSNDARLLFLTYPFENSMNRLEISQVHLLLIGFGDLGECIFLKAAQMCHYTHTRSVMITILNTDSNVKEKSFIYNFPGLERLKEFYSTSKTFDYRFIDINLDDLQSVEVKILELNQKNQVSAVILCQEDENENLRVGLELMNILKRNELPIRFHLPFAIYLDENEDILKFPSDYTLKPYGLLVNTCTKEVIAQGFLDKIAKAIHKDYYENEIKKGKTLENNPNLKPWEKIDGKTKGSNRKQADHLLIKLRALKIKVEPFNKKTSSEFQFTDEEVNILAEMEHNRWCADRFIEGWITSDKKDYNKKEHPALIPYKNLPDETVQINYEIIRRIPKILKTLNLTLSR